MTFVVPTQNADRLYSTGSVVKTLLETAEFADNLRCKWQARTTSLKLCAAVWTTQAVMRTRLPNLTVRTSSQLDFGCEASSFVPCYLHDEGKTAQEQSLCCHSLDNLKAKQREHGNARSEGEQKNADCRNLKEEAEDEPLT
eukprot:2144784-Rhodomonas_salina.2